MYVTFAVYYMRNFAQLGLAAVRNISVFEATIENKTTSATTHFTRASSSGKADTLNI